MNTKTWLQCKPTSRSWSHFEPGFTTTLTFKTSTVPWPVVWPNLLCTRVLRVTFWKCPSYSGCRKIYGSCSPHSCAQGNIRSRAGLVSPPYAQVCQDVIKWDQDLAQYNNVKFVNFKFEPPLMWKSLTRKLIHSWSWIISLQISTVLLKQTTWTTCCKMKMFDIPIIIIGTIQQ